jgi:ribosomal protein S18 acetylase RimI-like enzyme
MSTAEVIKENPAASIHLRPVRDEDREFLCQVYASTREEELALVAWSSTQKDMFCRMQFDAQDKHYKKHYTGASFEIILSGDDPIGRLYVSRWPEEIRIIDIALLPAHRNRGAGSILIREILAEAEQAGKCVTIHVEKMNSARRLYDRLGFEHAEDNGVYDLLRWQSSAGQPKTAS